MRLYKLLLVIGIFFTTILGQVEIVNPGINFNSAFAIIIDSETYQHTKDAVMKYKNSVEENGLSTYIVSGKWKNPDEVKNEILKLNELKPKLEGVVFIGEIPIAMIRNAQHLCSAFKMDEDRYPWFRSSVPSDRFYDDFDLKFKYLKQDSIHPLCHYYSLLPESPQKIEKDIYSARIIPGIKQGNSYELINKFLLKVVEQKKKKEFIDNAFVFTGQGYMSEDLTAWADERLLLKEQFPQLFVPGGKIKNLYHEMSNEMKEKLLIELQQKELDLAIFHAHGDEDLQLLIGYPKAEMITQNVEAIKLFLRSKIRSAKDRKQSVEKTKEYYQKEYEIPDSWFDGAFDDSLIIADSILAYSLDIHIDDVKKISPQAKFIMFDECFNGSFHQEEYIAGEYLFGNGNVISAEANSVNVLQDKWADELLGLLNEGVRIGLRHKEINILESHLFGDPTFSFNSNSKNDLNNLLVNERNNLFKLQSFLEDDDPVVAGLAIHLINKIQKNNFDKYLYERYVSEPSINIRLHLIKCLGENNSDEFRKILLKSISDPYEYIRRKSVEWMGEIGDTIYLQYLVNSILYESSKRVSFNALTALWFIDINKAAIELKKQINEMPEIASKEKLLSYYNSSADRNRKWLYDELMQNIYSDTSKLKSKLNDTRTFRNYKFHEAIPYLLKLLVDEKQENQLRINIAEALGWYTFSIQKDLILNTIQKLINRPNKKNELNQELIRSKNRLIIGANNSFLP